MSPILPFLGISVLGTWGLAAIGIIAGGIILLVDPGDSESAVSGSTIPGITLIIFGLVNLVIMSGMVAPLLGMDPPLPVSKQMSWNGSHNGWDIRLEPEALRPPAVRSQISARS